MATQSIETKIVDAAKEEGERILREAQEKRDDQLTKGKQELDQELERRRSLSQKHIEERVQQELSSLRLLERNKTLARKRELLEAVRDGLWESALKKDRYVEFVRQQLREHAQKGDTIMVPARQEELFRSELAEELDQLGVSIAEETGRFRGGFVIPRGPIRLNCTLDERLTALFVQYEAEAAKLLFA
jgi:vacuolar-type H+-ATPase subunit E/Vma4